MVSGPGSHGSTQAAGELQGKFCQGSCYTGCSRGGAKCTATRGKAFLFPALDVLLLFWFELEGGLHAWID